MSALFYANEVILQRLAKLRSVIGIADSYGSIPTEKAVRIIDFLQKGKHLFMVGQILSYVNGGYIRQFFPIDCFDILFTHILQLLIRNHRRFLPFVILGEKPHQKMKFPLFLRYDDLIVQYDRQKRTAAGAAPREFHPSGGLPEPCPLPATL
jgi:hypothetical protein